MNLLLKSRPLPFNLLFRRGLNTTISDPHFEIIDSGFGSLLHAKLPPYSQLLAPVGQTLGQSPHLHSRAAPHGPTPIALLRPLLGRRAFIQELSTEDKPADVLLSPSQQGDIAVIGMDGTHDLFVRRNTVLAHTKFLVKSIWHGLGSSALDYLNFDRVSGRGTLVVNGVGGIHRLVLKRDEEYWVDPRFVVAWESTLQIASEAGDRHKRPPSFKGASSLEMEKLANQPLPSKSDPQVHGTSAAELAGSTRAAPLVSSSPVLDNRVMAPARSPSEPVQKASYTSESMARKISQRIGRPLRRWIKEWSLGLLYGTGHWAKAGGWRMAKAIRTLAGVPELYRVTGPGNLYVTTRLMPRPWKRLTHSAAAKSSVS